MSAPPDLLSVTERPAVPAADPKAPTYLLVHGSMDRASSFRRIDRFVPEATVISYDRRGYAGSAARTISEAFADQVADLVEIVDGRSVVAFGHSFGGDVVLAAAAAHPELIRAAVVWEPPMPWLGWWPTGTAGSAALAPDRNPADVAEAFVRRLIGDHIWERLPAATRQARRDEGPALVAEMRSLRGDLGWDVAQVDVPVIVGVGSDSLAHHRRCTAALAEQLSHGELVVLPGARHGAHLSHPGDIAALLRRAAGLARGGRVGADGHRGAESAPTATDEESS